MTGWPLPANITTRPLHSRRTPRFLLRNRHRIRHINAVIILQDSHGRADEIIKLPAIRGTKK